MSKRVIDIIKSLRLRLIIMILVVAIFPSLTIAVGILNSYEARAISIRESEILNQAKILSNQIAKTGYLDGNHLGHQGGTVQTQMDYITTIYDGRVMVIDEEFRIYYDTYGIDENRIMISEDVIKSFTGNEIQKYDDNNHYIETCIPIVNPDDVHEEIRGVLVISVSTDNIALNLEYLSKTAQIIVLAVLTFVLFFGILAAIVMINPFNRLSEAIGMVQTGYGIEEISVREYTECAEICDQLNELLARMKIMDDSRQEFVSNVSHELKTPLTSMKVLADSINSMPDAPIELYQEFMGDITDEIERETKIINDLLSLVKMDKSMAHLNISTVNVNELVEQILKRLQPIADRQKVEIVLESFRPVSAEIDEVKITLAITNLVENAIKYNSDEGEGWVHVSLNSDHQYFYVKVEDNGMGIPEDSLEHIYERFYRVDKSHSREIGGTGLGLAITRNAILMHRGAIKAHSVVGEGTTFDVRIPLNYIM